MARNRFDQRFGEAFLSTIPHAPAIYRFWNAAGELVYVGKAKDLKLRLAQYRRAKRGEKAAKLISLTQKITWELCDSDLDASLKELRAIQQEKPAKNVAAAYSFRYPYLVIAQDEKLFHLGYTTRPDELTQFEIHGAYRSNYLVLETLKALTRVLPYLGHVDKNRRDYPAYSFGYAYRRITGEWVHLIRLWLKGESPTFVSTAFEKLLDHAGARANAAQVKEDLRALQTFFDEESAPLRRALIATGYESYPVPQSERDPLFLRARNR